MSKRFEQCHEALAAEYVLGTLRGRARARFERHLAGDRRLRATVTDWEGRLLPMTELAPPATPPASVWKGIERRLDGAPHRSVWSALWGSVALWRGLGLATTAALLIALTVALRPAAQPTPVIEAVALLETPAGQADWVLTANREKGQMLLRAVHHQHIGADRQCRLYLEGDDGYRAVAIMPEAGERTVDLGQQMVKDLVGKKLIISVEPNHAPFVTPTNPTPLKSRWVTF
ncbi:anti-sigma factor [Endothiovibrio diazotrophicus]